MLGNTLDNLVLICKKKLDLKIVALTLTKGRAYNERRNSISQNREWGFVFLLNR